MNSRRVAIEELYVGNTLSKQAMRDAAHHIAIFLMSRTADTFD
jgi:hypothetical protein